jgi:hypothetical protein
LEAILKEVAENQGLKEKISLALRSVFDFLSKEE